MTDHQAYTAARRTYETAKVATATAYREFIDFRDERRNIVAGNLPGDAGIAWTNEGRAQQHYLDALEDERNAYCDMNDAFDDLPTDDDVDHGERETCEREAFDGYVRNDAGEYLGIH